MSIQLSVDRFEGDGKQIAVLLGDQGISVDFPRALLPEGTRAGDVLIFEVKKDELATKSIADKTQELQNELRQDDEGGDLKL